jgi:hypothetical protein
MNYINAKLAELKKYLPQERGLGQLPGEAKRTYWLSRIVAQLEYAQAISRVRE